MRKEANYYSASSHLHGASSRGETAFYAPRPELVPAMIETMVGNVRQVTSAPLAPVTIAQSDLPTSEKVRNLWAWLTRGARDLDSP